MNFSFIGLFIDLTGLTPVIGLIGLIPALALLVYIIMFWVRYSTVCQWLFKWSKGQFTAPKKRYSLLLLHGVGLYIFSSLLPFGFLLILGAIGAGAGGIENMSTAATIGLLVLPFASIYLYWLICYKVRSKKGATRRQVAFEVLYGTLSLCAWVAIIVLAVYSIIIAVALVVLYFFIKLIFFFCFSEEITVKKPGLFGGTKKVWANRNLDGSYTDIEGKTYK